MEERTDNKEHQRQVTTAMAMLCVTAALNFVLIGVSFTQWFSGTAEMPGFADRLLGESRSGGFRLDFLWMLVSQLGFFFVLIGCAVKRKNYQARIAGIICITELGAFVLYIFHGLTSGVFYMG